MSDLITLCREHHYEVHENRELRMLKLNFDGSQVRHTLTDDGDNQWVIKDLASLVSFSDLKNAAQKIAKAGYRVNYGSGRLALTDDEGAEYILSEGMNQGVARRLRQFLFPYSRETEPPAPESTGLVPFAYKGHPVQVFLIDDVPWVSRWEICKILGLANPSQVTSGFPPHLLHTVEGLAEDGRRRQITVINEAGFFRLMRKSNKPEVDAFWDWVTDEVLPEIRKTGKYDPQTTHPPAAKEISLPAALRMIADGFEEVNSKLVAHDEQFAAHDEQFAANDKEVADLKVQVAFLQRELSSKVVPESGSARIAGADDVVGNMVVRWGKYGDKGFTVRDIYDLHQWYAVWAALGEDPRAVTCRQYHQAETDWWRAQISSPLDFPSTNGIDPESLYENI